MTSKEVIQKQIRTKKLGDELPISGWLHMPLVDHTTSDVFAKETIQLTDDYHWDFVKVMSSGHYLAEAYGAEIEFSEDPKEWSGKIHKYPVQSIQDLQELPILNQENPTLAREILNAKLLVEHYDGKLPVLATLFNPITWLQEMNRSGNPAFVQDLIQNHRKELHQGLETILATNLALLDELYKVGIDGIFLANQFASSNIISENAYREFVLPYDQEILKHLKGNTWFNLYHVHGDRNLLFDDVLEYEIEALNWEASPSYIAENEITTIQAIRQKTDKIIISGVDQHHDFTGTPAEIKERLKRRLHTALNENHGGGFIFAPGCALSLEVDREFYRLFYEVAQEEGLKK